MTQPPTVQVIIPARNEEASIGRCLESLAGQQGIEFEITVVDDGSTDRTHCIAESFPGVRVINASEPEPGVSGKSNALIKGAAAALARWLLFTDADTWHHPGSLARTVAEAEGRSADLFSLSPEQEAVTWSERALLPLIYAELARTYPPSRVSDPADSAVAANGQYLLVRREVYEGLGGHSAVANKILDDVELARIFKAAHHKICFRHGSGLVRTRMYRDFRSLVEGWTKNLFLLFPNALGLAAVRMLEFLAIIACLITAPLALFRGLSLAALIPTILAVLLLFSFFRRVLRAHFPFGSNLISFFGLPLFSWLLVRSWMHTKFRRSVTWKGRTYSNHVASRSLETSITERCEGLKNA